MNDINIFTDVLGNKTKLIGMLDQAKDAIKAGEIELVGQPFFHTAPAAYDLGIVKDKDACFFGFSFIKGNGKKTNGSQKEIPKETKQEAQPQLSTTDLYMVNRKISDREVERYKIGLDYVCGSLEDQSKRHDCGYKTNSPRGFKTHFNRCEIRKNEKAQKLVEKKRG